MRDTMGQLLAVAVRPEEPRPRFDVMVAYRLRLTIATVVLGAWLRQGFEFVTLVMTAGTLVLRPVKRCARADCHAPRLPPGETATGLHCEAHEGDIYESAGLRRPGILPTWATWGVMSPEAKRLLAMTLALGATYEEMPDPLGSGPGFEERLARLRAEWGEIETAAELVT